MRYLTAYVDQINVTRKIFKLHRLSTATHEDRQAIANQLASDLSPENLTCDGELPAAQVRNRYKLYTNALNELKALDPLVQIIAD